MQKMIRILAILAVVLVAASLMLLLVTLPFQGLLAELLDYPSSMRRALPMFPVVPFLRCLLRAVVMALLIICCGNKKGGIWLELVVLGCMVFVLPAINSLGSTVYNAWVSSWSSNRVAANAVVNMIANWCLAPSGWGTALAYVACGMSISFKHMSKKLKAAE